MKKLLKEYKKKNHAIKVQEAIDEATGEVVGTYFDTQKTLKGYYNFLYQILLNYGILAMVYTVLLRMSPIEY